MKNDEYYIQCCEELAKQAAAKGESPVGALIRKGDEIVSAASEAGKSKNDITCHAELEAIRLAVTRSKNADLSDCILYSTHEPCIMCSYAIRYYKIKKVVYRNAVKFLGGVSSSMPLLISDDVPSHWSKPPIIVELNRQKER